MNIKLEFHRSLLMTIISLSFFSLDSAAEDELRDDYFDTNFRIEPTPILVQGPTSAVYSLAWVQELSSGQKKVRHYEGSGGRDKREFNLEDFLMWMPSGDGPPERWNEKTTNPEWIKQYTKTVYVTETKYETVFMPPNIQVNPTEKGVFPTKATTNYFGKDFIGSFGKGINAGCTIISRTTPIFNSRYNFTATFPGSANPRDVGSSSSNRSSIDPIKNQYAPSPFGKEDSNTMLTSRAATRAPFLDIHDFLHPSLGYEKPFSLTHMQTSSATPTLPVRIESTHSFSLAASDSIVSKKYSPSYSTSYDPMLHTQAIPTKSVNVSVISKSHVALDTSSYPSRTPPSTVTESSQEDLTSNTSSVHSTLQSVLISTSTSVPIHDVHFDVFTNKSYVSTDKPSTHPIFPVTDVVSIPTYDSVSTTITTTLAQDTTKKDVAGLSQVPYSDSTEGEADVSTAAMITTTVPTVPCNCTTEKPSMHIHENREFEKGKGAAKSTLPGPTSSASAFYPSPSNNLTIPVDKIHWVRTVMNGPPKTNNTTEFRNDMTRKLTRVYSYAYFINKAAAGNRKRRFSETVVTSTESVMNTRSRREVSRSLKLIFISKPTFVNDSDADFETVARIKRQQPLEVSVRMQNITYIKNADLTELVYSVFVGDNPVEATVAVEQMSSVNDSVIENIIGYALAVKAEEYIKKADSENENDKYMAIFGIVIGSAVLLVTIVGLIACCYHKKNKRKQSQSTDELRERSKEYSYVRDPESTLGRDNLGFAESHDEESTPEGGSTRRSSPDQNGTEGMESLLHQASRPSTSRAGHEPVPMPRSTLLPPSRKRDSDYDDRTRRWESAETPDYAFIDMAAKRPDGRMRTPEHIYSTPKPLSQAQTNIQIGLDHGRFSLPEGEKDKMSGGFIPGTSLPKFLPPPRPQLPFMRSPPKDHRQPRSLSRNHSFDDTEWQRPGTSGAKDTELPSQVQEPPNLERSLSAISKGSSELEMSSGSAGGNGIGLGRLRRRFHDLLDDAFGLMQGQKTSDRVTPLTSPYHTQQSRAKSAVPPRKSRLLDELENGSRITESERPHGRLRPWSAAAVMHSPRDMISILPSGESAEGSPRSAWGDQGRSITPVNLPTSSSYDRPDSAPLGRIDSGRLRSPTPIDPETGLRMCDPAVPLIRAIKDELNRFKSTVNTDSSNA